MNQKESLENILAKLFIEPYRKLAEIKLLQARKSWNPFFRTWAVGFVEGLNAAADLVEGISKLRSETKEPIELAQIAKNLQNYYDEKLGHGKVSVGIGDNKFYIYKREMEINIQKPEWLEQEIEIRFLGT
jgi:hypothetical protein